MSGHLNKYGEREGNAGAQSHFDIHLFIITGTLCHQRTHFFLFCILPLKHIFIRKSNSAGLSFYFLLQETFLYGVSFMFNSI